MRWSYSKVHCILQGSGLYHFHASLVSGSSFCDLYSEFQVTSVLVQFTAIVLSKVLMALHHTHANEIIKCTGMSSAESVYLSIISVFRDILWFHWIVGWSICQK